MFSELRNDEKELALRCLASAARGDLFPIEDIEHHVGMSADDLAGLIGAYPDVDDSRYESIGFRALDLCLAHAARVRAGRDVPGVPETPREIEAVRMKVIGGK